MKKLKNKVRGFSLVELLAVVVILGIICTFGITTTYVLVEKAKETKTNNDKNTISMAAQSYIQNNKNLVPKIIGESVNIKVSDLRTNNYLTEDIKNSNGESCMENSYVRVYKLSNTEYIYTAYLYCGGEVPPEVEKIPKPIVNGNFTDSSGEAKIEKLNNVSDAYLFIEINAAKDDEIEEYKGQDNEIKLDGYSFKIYIVKDGTMQEAYNSGSLSAGREDKILISKKLNDYIDVTGVTEVSLEVTAINTLGGITTIHSTISENGTTDKTAYKDSINPNCIPPSTPYAEEDWIDKTDYNSKKKARKLTVGCDDGTGSGCTRNYFTKSWPNTKDDLGAEFVYIEVKDNAGNVSEKNEKCKFRVNVDIQTPQATVTAYEGKQSNLNDSEALINKINGENILKKSIKVDDSITNITIEPTDEYYDKLVGYETNDKWMNKENFANGVIYKIKLQDNIRLDRWTWETNAGYIDSEKDAKYLKVSSTNPESTKGVVPQDEEHGKTELHGSTEDVVYVRFLTEGMRYGVFTVYDKAGNSVKIKISANLDRTAPPVPTRLNAYLYDKERDAGKKATTDSYSFGTWTNKYVKVETASGQNRDNLTNDVTLSGFWQFYFDVKNNDDLKVEKNSYNTYSAGVGIYNFKGTPDEVDGKNKIRFKSCDKANNCSEYGNYENVWIDITVPLCSVEKKITNGDENKDGWLGKEETARVIATCSDPYSNKASGCKIDTLYHDYNYQISTTNAGAQGNKNGGEFSDYAGNVVKCLAQEEIHIDYENPTCTVSGGSKVWTNKDKKITGKCTDTGGSGCKGDNTHVYTDDIKTDNAGPDGDNQGGYVYDIADNRASCAANQSVYLDKTKPYIVWTPEPGRFDYDETNTNREQIILITCNDDLSGFGNSNQTIGGNHIPIPTTKNGKTIEKCCIDNANNSYCETKTYYTTHYHEDSSCGVKLYKECRAKVCGVETYNKCETKDCGVLSYNSCRTKACGVDTYEWTCSSNLAGTRIFTVYSYNHPYGGHGYCGKTGTIYDSCENSKCGVKSYKTCRDDACGVEYYNKCRAQSCGVQEYNKCYHYKPCDNIS